MSEVRIVHLEETDLGKTRMFCGLSPTYRQGYTAKMEWVQKRLREGMRHTLLHIDTAYQAQNSACPYGVLGVFYNGELLEYRPTGTEKLLELIRMKSETVP